MQDLKNIVYIEIAKCYFFVKYNFVFCRFYAIINMQESNIFKELDV